MRTCLYPSRGRIDRERARDSAGGNWRKPRPKPPRSFFGLIDDEEQVANRARRFPPVRVGPRCRINAALATRSTSVLLHRRLRCRDHLRTLLSFLLRLLRHAEGRATSCRHQREGPEDSRCLIVKNWSRFIRSRLPNTGRRWRGSYRTPLGELEVAQKIGDGMPPGTVFKDRRRTGEIVRYPMLPGAIRSLAELFGCVDESRKTRMPSAVNLIPERRKNETWDCRSVTVACE